MYVSLLIAAVVLPVADGVKPTVTSSPDSVTVSHCLISLIDEAQVPAREGGVLTRMLVNEGDQVSQGQLLAQIDDTLAIHEHDATKYRHAVAKEESTNDVNVRYAKAAADVYKADCQQYYEANRHVPGTVSQTEIRQKELRHREAMLQGEASEFKMQMAALDAKVREAEVRSAAEQVERRKIVSPINGMVVERRRREGEWVQPGDPVLHVVRLDRLRVESFLPASQYSPAEVDKRPVTVTVTLARGRKESFEGKVVFPSPEVEAGGEFRVWAEVYNRQENEHWLLGKGMEVEMTIHLK